MSDILEILADDRINQKDSFKLDLFDATKAVSKKGARFHTELKFEDEFGRVLFTDSNELMLAGGMHTLAKLANVDKPILLKTMNKDLSVAAVEEAVPYKGPRREDVIFGFAIGIGGCGDMFDTVNPVYYNERTITSQIPFRKVKTDMGLSPTERNQYYMKKTAGAYHEYYIKKFETEPILKAEYDDPSFGPVPVEPDKADPNRIINTYLEFKLKIGPEDVREYFKINGVGLRKARVNTLGLVHGYKDNNANEYKGVNLWSKITFNNEALDNETKAIIVTYKVYI